MAPGRTFITVMGYRVRPSDLSVSFGERKVYCLNAADLDVVSTPEPETVTISSRRPSAGPTHAVSTSPASQRPPCSLT